MLHKKLPFLVLIFLGFSGIAHAQFTTIATSSTTVTITGYSGAGGAISIPSVTGSMTVTAIGNAAFNNTPITSATIPATVISIGTVPFINCSSLQSISVDPLNPVFSSTNGVLYNKQITSLVEYPHGKTGSFAIPATVTTILPSALQSSGNLSSVIISGSVTTMGANAFSGCILLGNVTIPKSVTAIGTTVFNLCSSMAAITVDSQNPVYSSTDGILYDKSQATLIEVPCGKSGTATLPATVTAIGDSAARECGKLVQVLIPQGVTYLGSEAFYDTGLTSVTLPASVNSIGIYCFNTCEQIVSFTVDPANTSYCSRDDVLFDAHQTTLIQYPLHKANTFYAIPPTVTQIASGAFYQANFISSLQIPESLTTIGPDAFYDMMNLASVVIPNGVETIGNEAFFYDENLTNLQISDGVKTVDASAFAYCTSLAGVTIPGTVTTINDSAFANCTGLQKAIFTGNAPSTVNPNCFDNTAANFTIYYHPGATGFTTPAWLGHPCYPLAFPVRSQGDSLKLQTSNGASLQDGINPTGVPTTVYYQYGTSLAYGSTTTSKNIGSGNSPVSLTCTLAGLTPDTTYYYQLVMTCSNGTFDGPTESFTTFEQGSGDYTAYLDGIWDLSGTYSAALTNGPHVHFLVNQDFSGKAIGSGSFTQNDAAGSWTGTENITGQIKSSGTIPILSLAYACSGSGTQVSGSTTDPSSFSGKLTLSFEVDAAGSALVSKGGSFKYTATDKVTGKKVSATRKIQGGDTAILPAGRTSDFDLALHLVPSGATYSGTATGTASSGQKIGFNVTGKYAAKSGLSTLTLKGGSGCSMSISTGFFGNTIDVQSLKAKVLGQSVSN